MCGGTSVSVGYFCHALGLSPRVRGNLSFSSAPTVFMGSIPACAGEPTYPAPTRILPKVYPRVCGGTSFCELLFGAVWGLSPRVRGNRRRSRLGCDRAGSIPACAGEPRTCCTSGRKAQVYPRVCGGTRLQALQRPNPQGLSPRVRGNPGREGGWDGWQGSIPACAGEPFPARSLPPSMRVYPRVCGGTRKSSMTKLYLVGLSPRVRGNLERSTQELFVHAKVGSIPACRGNRARRP